MTPQAEGRSDTADLVRAVERLSDELRILREVIDGIREDVSWVTRNGLPIQPIEHVIVKRIALNPTAADWSEQLVVERSRLDGRGESVGFDDIPERIAETLVTVLEGVAPGQLEILLHAFDQVRNELRTMLAKSDEPPSPASELPPPGNSRATGPRPPPGHLF